MRSSSAEIGCFIHFKHAASWLALNRAGSVCSHAADTYAAVTQPWRFILKFNFIEISVLASSSKVAVFPVAGIKIHNFHGVLGRDKNSSSAAILASDFLSMRSFPRNTCMKTVLCRCSGSAGFVDFKGNVHSPCAAISRLEVSRRGRGYFNRAGSFRDYSRNAKMNMEHEMPRRAMKIGICGVRGVFSVMNARSGDERVK